jgi:uncharacterized protein YggE
MDYELIRQSINRAQALANKLGLNLDDVFQVRLAELKKAHGRGHPN